MSIFSTHAARTGAGVLAVVLALTALASNAATVDSIPSTPAEHGVWQKHEYSFSFLGFTTTYSCDGLADKLKLLLLAAGARPDVKSYPGVCASGFGRPDKFAQARLTFYTLAVPDAAKPGEPSVGGAWRAVAFADRSPRELHTGDCELVEQFRSNVLPLFSTRNVEDQTTCVPHQDSGSVINLKFEAFAAVKPAPRV